MRNERPLDIHQHNAKLIALQTGSRVYAPPGVEWTPRPNRGIRIVGRLLAYAFSTLGFLAALLALWSLTSHG